jgi:hypothetical protein
MRISRSDGYYDYNNEESKVKLIPKMAPRCRIPGTGERKIMESHPQVTVCCMVVLLTV